jgi:hypothetical protein
MNKNKQHMGRTLVILLACGWATHSSAEETNPWEFLPARVLQIEGGLVAFRGAVIVDTTQAPSAFAKYPTKYILPVTNETAIPIWIDAEWRVPKQKPFRSSGKLDPGEFGSFYIEVKEVAWNTPNPVQTTIYADANRSRKLGEREVVLQFGEGPDKDAFVKMAKDVNSMSAKFAGASGNERQMPLLGGFQEMAESGPVAGTSADDTLNHDIRLLLWRNESLHHWDCGHEVLGASAFDPQTSKELAALPAEQRQLVETGLTSGELKAEQWQIKSCDTTTSYLVMMGKSPKGGTDVMAVPLGAAPSP